LILKILVLIISLIPSILFAQANQELTSAVTSQPEVTESTDFSDEAIETKQPSPDSIEDLMIEKLDVVKKVEKIEKIESIVDGSNKSNPDQSTIHQDDKKGYRPLYDKDPKTVQATPPFSLKGN
jgi:hypothetical protein